MGRNDPTSSFGEPAPIRFSLRSCILGQLRHGASRPAGQGVTVEPFQNLAMGELLPGSWQLQVEEPPLTLFQFFFIIQGSHQQLNHCCPLARCLLGTGQRQTMVHLVMGDCTSAFDGDKFGFVHLSAEAR